jgi:hypothetical protein
VETCGRKVVAEGFQVGRTLASCVHLTSGAIVAPPAIS